jgi:hypothetical protein
MYQIRINASARTSTKMLIMEATLRRNGKSTNSRNYIMNLQNNMTKRNKSNLCGDDNFNFLFHVLISTRWSIRMDKFIFSYSSSIRWFMITDFFSYVVPTYYLQNISKQILARLVPSTPCLLQQIDPFNKMIHDYGFVFSYVVPTTYRI